MNGRNSAKDIMPADVSMRYIVQRTRTTVGESRIVPPSSQQPRPRLLDRGKPSRRAEGEAGGEADAVAPSRSPRAPGGQRPLYQPPPVRGNRSASRRGSTVESLPRRQRRATKGTRLETRVYG